LPQASGLTKILLSPLTSSVKTYGFATFPSRGRLLEKGLTENFTFLSA
jgi:hypothetical protein